MKKGLGYSDHELLTFYKIGDLTSDITFVK